MCFFAHIMRVSFVLIIGLVALAGGCASQYREGVYTDPGTGKVYDAYYVDPAGWRVDHIWPIEECFPKYWEIKDTMENGAPGQRRVFARAWAMKHATGVYKYNLYAIEQGSWNFMVFDIHCRPGVQLRWRQQSVLDLWTITGGDTVVFRSKEISFTKEQQYRVFNTSDAPVTVSADGGWDVQGRGLFGYARFDFSEGVPDHILFCVPHGVKNLEATTPNPREL